MLLTQILQLLVETAAGFLTFLLLARVAMQWARISFRNPFGQFIIQLTDWIVLPARRVLPALGRLDLPTLSAAWLIQLAEFLLLLLVRGALPESGLGMAIAAAASFALFKLAHLAIWLLIVAVIVAAVMSWVSPFHPAARLLTAFIQPLLAPIQRVLPRPGNIDLSPLVLIVLLQIVQLVLGSLEMSLQRALL